MGYVCDVWNRQTSFQMTTDTRLERQLRHDSMLTMEPVHGKQPAIVHEFSRVFLSFIACCTKISFRISCCCVQKMRKNKNIFWVLVFPGMYGDGNADGLFQWKHVPSVFLRLQGVCRELLDEIWCYASPTLDHYWIRWLCELKGFPFIFLLFHLLNKCLMSVLNVSYERRELSKC